MNDYDRNEDRIFWGAFALIAVWAAIGLIVLLSGHGIVTPPAQQVSPNEVATTMGPPSTTAP